MQRSVKLLAIAAAALLGAASLSLASGPHPASSVSIDLPEGLFKPAIEPRRAKPRTGMAFDAAPAFVTRVSFNLPAGQFAPLWSRVAARMKAMLSRELASNFDLFVYVNKAAHGDTAQRMYVFDRKQKDFALRYDWLVSTGREKLEPNLQGLWRKSDTPKGFYELDPDRFYVNYRSLSWDSPMPHAMFFDWVRNGGKTGLAIHATDHEDQLGKRASAGCVRLSLDHARILFELVKSQYRGLVPLWAYDAATRSTNNKGVLAHDAKGRIRFAEGYRVLVFIDDNAGSERVATLF
ncbi:MAG TPA: L,D-transpeptidase [Rhizomicrobium sp.]|nr:L,D-transpeptidase [Rhizomicrobium sp.]